MAQADIEHLDVGLDAIDTVYEFFECFGDGGQEVAWVCLPERGAADIFLVHRARAGQQPRGIEREGDTEGFEELHARGVPAEVSSDGFGVMAGCFGDCFVGSIATGGFDSFVER
jgi:hypothetical protein